MLTLLSILLLLAAIFTFGWKQMKNSFDEQDLKNEKYNETVEQNFHKRPIKSFPPFPLKVKSWMLLTSAVLIFMLNGLFFWADAGTAYAVQYPWGGDKMITTQGVKIKAWGRTIPLSYETSIKDIILKPQNIEGEMKTPKLPESERGIYNRRAQKWEFSDAIKADIASAVIVGVSIDDRDKFLKMADRNRSEGKLISGRILPNIDAALKNTCKLMDAQEYISGKASDFDRYFKDQLENGMYLVEEYLPETTMGQIIGDTTTIRTVGGDQNEQKKYRIKKDDQGNIMRDTTSNTLKQYGLTIYQAKVTSIDWEDSFDERLDKQKNEVALTQLEKQEAERQYYTTKKEIAKGEAEKAAERALLEKEQIKLTIAAETKAKVAEQNVIVERSQLEVEKLKAQSVKVAAEAQYYKNSKLVQARLTPQERKEQEEIMNRDKWLNIGKMNFNGVYITGESGNGSDGLLSQLLGAEVAKGMKLKNQ